MRLLFRISPANASCTSLTDIGWALGSSKPINPIRTATLFAAQYQLSDELHGRTEAIVFPPIFRPQIHT